MEKLFGLIGEKLSHTYSPYINKKIMQQINIEGHYGLFQVKKENLKDVVPGLKALGYQGINVTIPYKTQIIPYLDKLSEEAEKIGAVNVVSIENNGLAIGYNTDYYGFGMMLEDAKVKIQGENAVILGTGGASKAVYQYLKDNKINKIVFVSRDIEAAKRKYPGEEVLTYEELDKIKNYSTVINTTPLGMYPKTEAIPVDKRHLQNFSQAIDLVYNPLETLFIKQAKELGLKGINGLYMLVAQAVKSQEIWNEVEIPDSIILNILDSLKQEI